MENHNLLSVFSFKGHRIRYTKNNSEYWWVAKDIQKLFAIPQTSESLEIINQTVKGGQPLEQEFHKEFEQYRLSGEWFSWSEDILAKFKSVLIAQNLEEN